MTLALLWRYRAALGWGLAVVIGLTLWSSNNRHHEEIGAMRERMKQDAATIARQERAAETLGVRLRVDTVRVRQTVTHFDTLVQQERITDTVWVRETIAAADTAVKACRRALNDCAVIVPLKDSIIAKLKVRLREQTKLTRPSKYGLAVKLAGAAALGYGLHALVHR